MTETKIDTTNKMLLGAIGPNFVISKPPSIEMSKDEAINLAAWIVAMADPTREQFDPLLSAILET